MSDLTPRGFAEWLAAMDDPDSASRRTVTLDQIVTAAKEAVSSPEPPVYEVERDRFGTMYSGPLEIGECLRVRVVER